MRDTAAPHPPAHPPPTDEALLLDVRKEEAGEAAGCGRVLDHIHNDSWLRRRALERLRTRMPMQQRRCLGPGRRGGSVYFGVMVRGWDTGAMQ